MPAYTEHTIGMDYIRKLSTGPGLGSGNAAAGLDPNDTTHIGRAVQQSTTNAEAVELVADDGEVFGVIHGFDSGKVTIGIGPVSVYKHSANTLITLNARIVGATRDISATRTNERGYVKAAPETPPANSAAGIRNYSYGRGRTLNAGPANTANTDSSRSVVVAMF